MKLEPGTQLETYVVKGELGHGGMSDVFLARDDAEEREVVLKFPHADLLGDPKTHEHFMREVKIGQLLDHRNIQKLYRVGGDVREPFLVLEYVPGATLRDLMESGQLSSNIALSERIAEARRVGVQIAHALAYAHALHVAHRDLKPENVIVTADGQAKVMDFGVAYIEGARRVTWGALSAQVGTPDYMAPEQIRGVRGDNRTDIYALGMMLYEIIAARLPYEGDNALAVMSQHVNQNAPPIHTLCRDVPVDVEEIVMKAIRREPDERWQTMDEFAAALDAPGSVDSEALRVERTSLPKGQRELKGVALEIGMPIWKLLAIIAAIFAFAVGIGVAAQVMHAAQRH